MQAFVPSNDSLFALLIHLCGQYGVGRAPASLLEWIPRDEDEHRNPNHVRMGLLKDFQFSPNTVLGNKGICIFIELVGECQLAESISFVGLPDMFQHDALKTTLSGNEVIETMVRVLRSHPSIRKLDLRGHSVGSFAAKLLQRLAEENTRIEEIMLDERNLVDEKTLSHISKCLAGRHLHPIQPAALRHTPSERLMKLGQFDRKSAMQQNELYSLLRENPYAFGGSADEILDMVTRAAFVSLGECVRDSVGLRGDQTHLYLIASGELKATIGTQECRLSRGDFFGDDSDLVPFAAGRIDVSARGYCFRIPLDSMKETIGRWGKNSEKMYPLLKSCPMLQALPIWVIMRLSHCATEERYSQGEAVVAKGDDYSGLYFIVRGTCGNIDDRRPLFSDGDLFGEEPLLGRKDKASTSIAALSEDVETLKLDPGCCKRHVVEPMRSVFFSHCLVYSTDPFFHKK